MLHGERNIKIISKNTIMKNFWKSLMIVLVSVFALASCEDVPAPYPNPDNGENGGGNTNEEVAPSGEGTF